MIDTVRQLFFRLVYRFPLHTHDLKIDLEGETAPDLGSHDTCTCSS